MPPELLRRAHKEKKKKKGRKIEKIHTRQRSDEIGLDEEEEREKEETMIEESFSRNTSRSCDAVLFFCWHKLLLITRKKRGKERGFNHK